MAFWYREFFLQNSQSQISAGYIKLEDLPGCAVLTGSVGGHIKCDIYGFYPTMQSIPLSKLVVMLYFNNLYIISGLVVSPKNWIFMGLETVFNSLKVSC